MTFDASQHAGDRSFERNIDHTLVNHVIRTGGQTIQNNGNILHVARDPNNIDHIIKVITTPHPKKIITVIRDTSRPFAQEQAVAKENTQKKETARIAAATTKRKQAEQKAKKHKRNPPKNKQ